MKREFQEQVREIIDDALENGDELGVQCVVMRDGEILAEHCGGFSDARKTRPVTPSTLFPVFSTGKSHLSTLALTLIERGIIGLDERLAEVWREFGNGELSKVTFRHVLTHTTGLHIMPRVTSPAEFTDWEGMCARMCARRPAWEPGTRTQYQPLTYSWLLGGALEHATGKTLPALLTQEILIPCGANSDTFFGIPESEEHRLAELTMDDELAAQNPPRQTFLEPLTNAFRCRSVRAACLPAFNCMSDARGLALFGTRLIQNGYISDQMLDQATTLQRPPNEPIPTDDLEKYWGIFGLGFLLLAPPPERGRLFGHQGHGGSEMLIDKKTRTVFAFAKNRLSHKVVQPMKERIRRIFI